MWSKEKNTKGGVKDCTKIIMERGGVRTEGGRGHFIFDEGRAVLWRKYLLFFSTCMIYILKKEIKWLHQKDDFHGLHKGAFCHMQML